MYNYFNSQMWSRMLIKLSFADLICCPKNCRKNFVQEDKSIFDKSQSWLTNKFCRYKEDSVIFLFQILCKLPTLLLYEESSVDNSSFTRCLCCATTVANLRRLCWTSKKHFVLLWKATMPKLFAMWTMSEEVLALEYPNPPPPRKQHATAKMPTGRLHGLWVTLFFFRKMYRHLKSLQHENLEYSLVLWSFTLARVRYDGLE